MPRVERFVPDAYVPDLAKRVEQIARRAQRLGLEPPRLEILPTTKIVDVPIDKRLTAPVLHRLVAIEGETVVINGWVVKAVIKHQEDGLNLIFGNDPEIAKPYREAKPYCEHCHTTRYRTQTAILYNPETGEVKQVGSSCLKDFTKGHDPERALDLVLLQHEAQSLLDEYDGFRSQGYTSPDYTTRAVLALAAYLVRKHGFVSRKRADLLGETLATVDRIYAWFDTARAKRPTPTISDLDVADRVIEWAKQLEDDGGYYGNVRAAVLRPYADLSLFGILASAVDSFRRHIESSTADVERASAKRAGYFGTVGERVECEVDILRTNTFVGVYGYTTYVTMRTDEGHLLLWKASGDRGLDLTRGDRIRIRGTVKEHTDYEGSPQTVLTRCKYEIVATVAEHQQKKHEASVALVWRDEASILEEKPRIAEELEHLFSWHGLIANRYEHQAKRYEEIVTNAMIDAVAEEPVPNVVFSTETAVVTETPSPTVAEESQESHPALPSPASPKPETERVRQLNLF